MLLRSRVHEVHMKKLQKIFESRLMNKYNKRVGHQNLPGPGLMQMFGRDHLDLCSIMSNTLSFSCLVEWSYGAGAKHRAV